MNDPPDNTRTHGNPANIVNDQQVDNRNTPSYLSHYGMFRPPFMTNTIEDDMYYPEPTRTQRLDILLHLAQYGNELLLVTGPEGSGKTTMLQQFMKKIGEGWRVCQINAHNMMTEEQLLSRVSRGFDLPDESGPTEKVKANLKRRLDAMLTTHQTVVIALDNAQILSTGALNLLLELATIRNVSKGIAVRVLLFSEPQIKIQLASPELQSRQTLPIRKIDLPPFDEQQTARLIRHRVTTAGLVSKHVFNDAIVSKIYKYSQGWPGLITEIAHQVLFESTPLKRRDNSSKPILGGTPVKSGHRSIPIIIAVLMFAGLAGLLLFQEQISGLFKSDTHTVQQDNDEQTAHTLDAPAQSQGGSNLAAVKKPITLSAANQVEEQEFPDVSEPVRNTNSENTMAANTSGNSQTSSESTAEMAGSNDNTGETSSTPATPPNAMPETTPGSQTSTEPSAEDQTLNTPDTMAAKTVASNRAASSKSGRNSSIPLDHQEAWILAQNPENYTLQLVAGYQESTVVNFIASQQLPTTDLAYYYSLNRNRGWHSLIFGSYPNRDQAKGSAAEIRKHIKHLKPWIRSFKSVQGDIRYARKHSP